jgi:DNA polymerase III epsilon subunit-like protein
MIVLSYDFETSGLDVAQDRVIEVGAALWSTGQHRLLEQVGFLVRPNLEISDERWAEITEITGITKAAVERFGVEETEALSSFLELARAAEAFLGQNIVRFDNRILQNWIGRFGCSPDAVSGKPIIDTLTDIPGVEGRKLQYMLADHMRLNPFPHSALTDALSCVILLDAHTAVNGNIDPILERAASPFVILQSLHPRNQNNQAKKPPFRFRWSPDRKIWWKALKQIDLDEFRKNYQFETVVREDLTQDQLESE